PPREGGGSGDRIHRWLVGRDFAGCRPLTEDGRDDVFQARNRLKAIEFLAGANPAVLDVLPVEADSATRAVEQELMDHVHCLVLSRENRGSRGSEREAS